MTERQLSKAVVELAERLGWRVFTISNTKGGALRSHTGVGFPDLVMVRDGRMLAMELKVGRNTPTDAQDAWLVDLDAVPGVEAGWWNEACWHNGTIEEVLREEVLG